MDPYGTAALKPSEWCGRVWGCLHSVVIVTPSTLWGESQRSPMHHRQGTGLAHDVVPRCFCWPRSSPRQETAPKRFSLWRSAENKQQIWMHPLRKRSRTCRGEVRSLTPTILFMASSLSDSLLLSNISLRSSFLWINNTVTDTWCGQYENKKTLWRRRGWAAAAWPRGWERYASVTSVSASQIKETSQGYSWSKNQ